MAGLKVKPKGTGTEMRQAAAPATLNVSQTRQRIGTVNTQHQNAAKPQTESQTAATNRIGQHIESGREKCFFPFDLQGANREAGMAERGQSIYDANSTSQSATQQAEPYLSRGRNQAIRDGFRRSYQHIARDQFPQAVKDAIGASGQCIAGLDQQIAAGQTQRPGRQATPSQTPSTPERRAPQRPTPGQRATQTQTASQPERRATERAARRSARPRRRSLGGQIARGATRIHQRGQRIIRERGQRVATRARRTALGATGAAAVAEERTRRAAQRAANAVQRTPAGQATVAAAAEQVRASRTAAEVAARSVRAGARHTVRVARVAVRMTPRGRQALEAAQARARQTATTASTAARRIPGARQVARAATWTRQQISDMRRVRRLVQRGHRLRS
jgi:hypothetical protein